MEHEDTHTLWRSVLSDLELHVTKGTFQTFLARTTLVSLTETTATIGCPKAMQIGFLEARYRDLIQTTLSTHAKRNLTVLFTVFAAHGTKKEDTPLFRSPVTRIAPPTPQWSTRLNPDYTFDHFAVSTSNQMAYAAATAVAENPGASYNPLFLYGGTGVGKTHLMQAIGHAVLLQKPKTRIMYCTSEEFTNEIIEAIQSKTASIFKKRYRQVDMLLIDDVQFIAGKNTAQEEFFHTFNAIHQNKGQIMLTSDRPPEEMTKLEARLRSRFEGGLIIDIGQPDFELRTAILLIKAKRRGVLLPMEVAKIIASAVENPRRLEGVLVRILTESQTRNIPISAELASSIVGKTLTESAKQIRFTPDTAIHAVATHFNMKQSLLKSTKRDASIALPRQILYYLLKVELGMPLSAIGDFLGGRDHTTILHGVRKVTHLLSTDQKIQGDITGIKGKLSG